MVSNFVNKKYSLPGVREGENGMRDSEKWRERGSNGGMEEWGGGGREGGRRVRKRDTVGKGASASVAILTGLGAGLRSEPVG